MTFSISVIRFAFPISGIKIQLSMNSGIVKHNLINLLSPECRIYDIRNLNLIYDIGN